MHVPAKHIGTQILHQLIRPILPLPVIIIKINPLLNLVLLYAQVIQIDLHILIRDSRIIRVQVPETSSARDEHQPHYHVD